MQGFGGSEAFICTQHPGIIPGTQALPEDCIVWRGMNEYKSFAPTEDINDKDHPIHMGMANEDCPDCKDLKAGKGMVGGER